jgi:hypothetical protein
MTLTPDIENLCRNIVAEFVAATPEWWGEGELRLSFYSDDELDSCKHEISCVKFAKDIVVATDELMITTRLLNLRFKEMGKPLETAVFTINQADDGHWHFSTAFTYR